MSKKQIKKKGGSASKQVKKTTSKKPTSQTKKAAKPTKKAKPAPKAKKIVKNTGKPLLFKAKAAIKKAIKTVDKKISKTNSALVEKKPVIPVSASLKKINQEANKVTKLIVEKTQANQLIKPLLNVNAGQINQQKLNEGDMKDEKLRYSEDELKEFEALISEKLGQAKKELTYIKEALSRKNDPGTDTTAGTLKLLEDGADTAEKESFTQLAARQQKFIQQLENAMARIKNGTYGICVETGKLIPKERLRAVPHTQHSIEAKLNRKD
jgi:DnaK suppressor protein